MKQVKFIHSADLHLDSPMIGLKHLPKKIFQRLQESTFQALRALIDAAITHKIDFVIIAGDLFDNDDRSLRAQTRLRKEMERLEQEGISCYFVFGNHDHLSGSWTHIEMPKNVQVFDEAVEAKEFITKEGTIVHLYGFSYPERHVFERKIQDYDKKAGADFHIGILHGNLEGNGEHGNYAPFHLKELLEKDFDYWALGHIHKRAIISESPPVIYPGNIQGRNKKEKDIKGCYAVTLNESGSTLQFIETSDCIWIELEVDAATVSSFDELYDACKERMTEERIEGKGILALMKIMNLRKDVYEVNSSVIEELLEILQEEEKEEESFVWPVTVNTQELINWKREELANDSDFYSELFDVIDSFSEIEESIAPLFKHHSARKFLTDLNLEDLKELKEEAEALLLQKLVRD